MERNRVVLLCPSNDAESLLIQKIAAVVGLIVLPSSQSLGAKLENEPDLIAQLNAVDRRIVWIVEIPGPECEAQLEELGYEVCPIDHHSYGKLDRSHDPKTGGRRPSSLEQFLAMAEVADDELRGLGEPRIIRGLGIFDDRYARGLREDGYSLEEIRQVLKLRASLIRELNPSFAAVQQAAEEAWKEREERNGYIIIRALGKIGVRGEAGIITIREDCDEQPLVIIEPNGSATFVQNVDEADVFVLLAEFQQLFYNVFSFGAGRCFGTDGRSNRGLAVPSAEILKVLGL